MTQASSSLGARAMTGVSRRRPAPLESVVQRAVLDYLETQPRVLWAMRANAGLQVVGEGRHRRAIKGAPAGTADIIVCGPGGRFLGIEVKRPGGKLTAAQIRWAEMIRDLGGVAEVVTSVAEVRAVVEGMRGTQ